MSLEIQRMLRSKWSKILLTLWLLVGVLPMGVNAHVKWFADSEFTDPPLSLAEVITPTFIGLAILSVVVISSLVFVDKLLHRFELYQTIEDWLQERREQSSVVMRIAVGATLLLSWQAGSLLVPDLPLPYEWLGWVEFVLVLMLLSRRTTPYAGIGVIVLYFIGFAFYPSFYMLDYIIWLGAGFYLFVSQSDNLQTRELGIPALYATVGFSLCWVALEKLIYPQWSNQILAMNPALTLGFPPDFFRQAAAMVEFSLGFLLIICLLQRPLSLVITLVFFMTTLVFGKTEVIGHTVIHGALVVFLLEGPGRIYRAPITFPKTMWARSIFAGASFLLLLFVLLLPYTWGASTIYEEEVAKLDDIPAVAQPYKTSQVTSR